MILQLNQKEREVVLLALRILAEEYLAISETNISEFSRRRFRQDASDANQIAGRAGLEDPPALDVFHTEIRRLMRAKRKIEAIKYVREHRWVSLIEAKEYVEKIGE